VSEGARKAVTPGVIAVTWAWRAMPAPLLQGRPIGERDLPSHDAHPISILEISSWRATPSRDLRRSSVRSSDASTAFDREAPGFLGEVEQEARDPSGHVESTRPPIFSSARRSRRDSSVSSDHARPATTPHDGGNPRDGARGDANLPSQ
jgi:hypothetical protein